MPLTPQLGTIIVDDGATVATLTGLNLADFRTGDSLSAGTVNRHDIAAVDDLAGTVDFFLPWSGGDLAGADCVLRPDAPSRFDDVEIDDRTLRILRIIEAQPFQITVTPGGLPSNADGEDGNAAIRWFPFPMTWFEKVDGVWLNRGTPIGYNQTGDYNGATVYKSGDVAKQGGKVYVYINTVPSAGHAPPNATYWTLVVENGDMYDVATFDTDRPAAGELVVKVVFVRHTLFPINLGDTRFHAEAAATSSSAYRFFKNTAGAPFGTVTFAPGAQIPVNAGVETAFEAGDILRVYAPAVRDATLSGVAGTVAAFR